MVLMLLRVLCRSSWTDRQLWWLSSLFGVLTGWYFGLRLCPPPGVLWACLPSVLGWTPLPVVMQLFMHPTCLFDI
jgi:hypothetical protein